MSAYTRFAPGAAVILLLVNLTMLFEQIIIGGVGLMGTMFSMLMKIWTGWGEEFSQFTKTASAIGVAGLLLAIPTLMMTAFYLREMSRPSGLKPPVIGWWASVLFHAVAFLISVRFIPGTRTIGGTQIPDWVFNAVGVVISVGMIAACLARPRSTTDRVSDHING